MVVLNVTSVVWCGNNRISLSFATPAAAKSVAAPLILTTTTTDSKGAGQQMTFTQLKRNSTNTNRFDQIDISPNEYFIDLECGVGQVVFQMATSTPSQTDLLGKAKLIVARHKELLVMATKLQNQRNTIEQEQKNSMMAQVKQLAAKYFEVSPDEDLELSVTSFQKLTLKANRQCTVAAQEIVSTGLITRECFGLHREGK